MSYELEVNLPNLPKGAEVHVAYLGSFKNGTRSQVDDNMLAVWKETNATTETDDEGNEVRVLPTLGKANFPEGVTVHRTKSTPSDKKEDDKKQEGGN